MLDRITDTTADNLAAARKALDDLASALVRYTITDAKGEDVSMWAWHYADEAREAIECLASDLGQPTKDDR